MTAEERVKQARRLVWIVCKRDAHQKKLQIEATVTERSLEVVEEGRKLLIDLEDDESAESPHLAAFPVGISPELELEAGISLREAEDELLEYVRRHTNANASLLASEKTRNVRGFIDSEMRELAAHFFYRSLDVCSFRELYSRWKCAEPQKFANLIEEMRFYRTELSKKRGIEIGSGEPDERIIWIDCEMTGLELGVHRIVEIACVVTDGNLEIVDVSDNIVIKQPLDVMRMMNHWCRKTFKKNGLMEQIAESEVSTEMAEGQMLEFLSQHVPKGVCPLAGNSIAVDRRFIEQDMPKLAEFFGPSDIDVTAVTKMDTLNADQIDYLLGFLPHSCLRKIQNASTGNPTWKAVSREHQHRPLANISLKWSREDKKVSINALKTEEGFVYRRWTRWRDTHNLFLKYLSICGRDGDKTGLPGFIESNLQQLIHLASIPTDGRSTYLQLYFIDEHCTDLMDALMPRLNYRFNRINIDTITGQVKHLETYLRKLASAKSVKKLEVQNSELTMETFDVFVDFFTQPNVEILKVVACTPEPNLEFFVQLVECWRRSENCSELIKYCNFDVGDDDIFVHLCDLYPMPSGSAPSRGRQLLVHNNYDRTLQLKIKELHSGIMEISVALRRPANRASPKRSRPE
ncbi:hypothetical protein QR680_011940 [Steinernema hermaphroditum]|uniref:Exonuclease domain-containing protein n=1 Tax=Steinernema hermaphroditum TaxID=289476 RepID=A0AA39I1U7_9BILA|nr:hypothetical protein QR680_011940 [Steinernema hermaphroditum]